MKKLILLVLIMQVFFAGICYARQECNLVFDSISIKATIYQQEDYNIIVPENLDKKKQQLEIDEIKEAFEFIDGKYSKSIKNIILVDFASPINVSEGKIVLASYGNGNIIFYRNDTYKAPMKLIRETFRFKVYENGPDIHQLLKSLIIHEVFHAYDEKNKISSSKEWQSIVDKDGYTLSLAVKLDYKEEFAESVAKYFTDKNYLIKNLTERHDYIEALFCQVQ